jgi:hypothetical protein
LSLRGVGALEKLNDFLKKYPQIFHGSSENVFLNGLHKDKQKERQEEDRREERRKTYH